MLSKLPVDALLYNEDDLSLGKMAMTLAMIDNEYDETLVRDFGENGYKCVITRAGGSGDNLKNKILRNALSAAEKSGIIASTPKNKHTITRGISNILAQIDNPLFSVSGGGVKLGILTRFGHLAIAMFGKLGIPGMKIDHEIMVLDVNYHCIEE